MGLLIDWAWSRKEQVILKIGKQKFSKPKIKEMKKEKNGIKFKNTVGQLQK